MSEEEFEEELEEEKKLEVTTELVTEEKLLDLGVSPQVIEQLKLELNRDYKKRMNVFKEEYHKYAQAGRSFSSTHIRRVRKRDRICFINMENDTLLVERVLDCDGVNITSKTYEYPLSLIKTIEIKLFPLLNVENKIILHLAIANTSSLDIANKMRNLSDSVFLRNILRYGSTKLMDKPIFKIVIASVLGGIAFYFAMLYVFKKAIIQIIGQVETTNPTPEA